MPPPGAGAGAHGLWESGGELGTWQGVEHLALEGWAGLGSPLRRNKVGRLNCGDQRNQTKGGIDRRWVWTSGPPRREWA